jgi:hypothetical protein
MGRRLAACLPVHAVQARGAGRAAGRSGQLLPTKIPQSTFASVGTFPFVMKESPLTKDCAG